MKVLALLSLLVVSAACGNDDDPVTAGPDTTDPPPAGACLEGDEDCEDIGVPDAPDVLPPAAPDPDGDGQELTIVEPTADAVDVQPQPWEELLPGEDDDDRTYLVSWLGGVAPCHVLDRVEVQETATQVDIALFTGAAPSAEDRACAAVVVPKAVRITLDQPLADRSVVDPASTDG